MDAATAEPDETTRLLTDQADEVRHRDGSDSSVPRQRLLQKQIVLLILVLVLLQCHLIFFNGASRELVMRRMCHEYYEKQPDRDDPGGRYGWSNCYFEEPVVERLRHFLNWDKGISSIVLLLVVVPYGMMADLRGKKRVVTLALIGQLLSYLWTVVIASFPDTFPLQLTWVAPAFWLIGGGTPLSITLIYLLASESLHEEQRSQLYFLLYGVYLLIETFMPIVAFLASIPSVYLELSIALAFLCGCLILLKFVDESSIRDESERQEDAESTVSNHPGEATVLPDQDSRQTNLHTLLRSPKVVVPLLVFILPAFAQTAMRACIPYFLVHRPPGQKRNEPFLALFPGEIFRIILFTFFIPWIIPFVQNRFGIRPSVVDAWIIRGSLLLFAISSAFVTTALTLPTRIIAVLVLFTGLGLRVALLSYITSLARPGLRGRLYGVVQVVETIAQLIAWPLAEHVVINIGKENSWVELPFFFTSVISVCFLALLMIPRAGFVR